MLFPYPLKYSSLVLRSNIVIEQQFNFQLRDGCQKKNATVVDGRPKIAVSIITQTVACGTLPLLPLCPLPPWRCVFPFTDCAFAADQGPQETRLAWFAFIFFVFVLLS